MRKYLLWGGLALVAFFLLIQAVPYGRTHTNPPVTKALALDAKTNRIFAAACADCHSNLSRYPWYANVAPSSWLVWNDIKGGRENLNISEWDKPQPSIQDVVEVISGGAMPPLKYKVMPNHADARLSSAEKQQLISGLRRAYAAEPPAGIKQGGEGG